MDVILLLLIQCFLSHSKVVSLIWHRSMKSTALTLTSDKYFERYAKFITEADGDPQRITSADDLEKYDVLVLSGGGDMGIPSGAYGEQTDNLPIGGVNDDRDLLEKQLLEKALEKKMPVLGICRGMLNKICG